MNKTQNGPYLGHIESIFPLIRYGVIFCRSLYLDSLRLSVVSMCSDFRFHNIDHCGVHTHYWSHSITGNVIFSIAGICLWGQKSHRLDVDINWSHLRLYITNSSEKWHWSHGELWKPECPRYPSCFYFKGLVGHAVCLCIDVAIPLAGSSEFINCLLVT